MPESTYVVLVRHAETDWNSEFRFQGHADQPLNEQGRASIPPVIEAIRAWSPVCIYTSDLMRAREMAEAAGDRLGIRVVSDERLRECSYGAWEGMTLDEIRRKFGDALDEWRRDEGGRDEGGHARGGGESLAGMQERTWERIEQIASQHRGQAVAVFTHSGPIRGSVCRLFGLGMEDRYRFQVDNASISALRLSRSGQWQLVLLNQISHLHPPGREASPAPGG